MDKVSVFLPHPVLLMFMRKPISNLSLLYYNPSIWAKLLLQSHENCNGNLRYSFRIMFYYLSYVLNNKQLNTLFFVVMMIMGYTQGSPLYNSIFGRLCNKFGIKPKRSKVHILGQSLLHTNPQFHVIYNKKAQ